MYYQEYRDMQNVPCLYTYYRQNNSTGKQNGVHVYNNQYELYRAIVNLLYGIFKSECRNLFSPTIIAAFM